LGVSKASLLVKEGPSYIPKDDELGVEWTDGYTLDDNVVHARSMAEHDVKLREVLDRLRTYKLKLQPEKCEFLRKEVSYLGHQITEAGVRPNPQKVAETERFPTPTNPRQLKAFCGMISYYRRFIPNAAELRHRYISF